jgi:hypothetical protein
VDVPDVKVQSRSGYFAPKNSRQFTHEDKELQLQQTTNLDVPFGDLPLVVEPAHFRQPDGRFYVVLAAKIPGSAVSLLDKSRAHETEFDFVWRADNAKGQPEGMLRDTLPVKLSGEDYGNVLHANFLYAGGMMLPPGKYTLNVVVRENESGKIGTFGEPLDKFPPGRYWLQLNVLDPTANQVSFARIPLAIIPPPVRAPVKAGGG